MGSCQAKAATRRSRDDRGRWKFVTSASTTRNVNPGRTTSAVSPAPAGTRPSSPPAPPAAPRGTRGRDRVRGFFGNDIGLGLEVVVLDLIRRDRPEGARAHVKHHLRGPDARGAQRLQEGRGEGKAGGR